MMGLLAPLSIWELISSDEIPKAFISFRTKTSFLSQILVIPASNKFCCSSYSFKLFSIPSFSCSLKRLPLRLDTNWSFCRDDLGKDRYISFGWGHLIPCNHRDSLIYRSRWIICSMLKETTCYFRIVKQILYFTWDNVSRQDALRFRMLLIISIQSSERWTGNSKRPSSMDFFNAATVEPLKGIVPVTMK